MLNQTTLDELWNFEDPQASEARFRAAVADPAYNADERAELTTQLGRAIGLQGRFEEADALLDAIDGDEPTVADGRTKQWLVALHNNLGWALHDAGRCAEAMVEFQLAGRPITAPATGRM